MIWAPLMSSNVWEGGGCVIDTPALCVCLALAVSSFIKSSLTCCFLETVSVMELSVCLVEKISYDYEFKLLKAISLPI